MPSDGETKYDLARAYIETGDVAEGTKLLEEAITAGYEKAAALLATLEKTSARKPSPNSAKPVPPRASPPTNAPGPNVYIDENHSGGLILDEHIRASPSPEISYWIVDGRTEQLMHGEEFRSYKKAEAWIEEHLPDLPRWNPPVPSNEEHEAMIRALNFLEEEGPDRWKHGKGAHKGVWMTLSYYLHQRTHRPEVVERIKAVLTENPYE